MFALAAVLLFVNVPPGAQVSVLEDGIYYHADGHDVSVQLVEALDAAEAIEELRQRAADDPGLALEDGVTFGYSSTLVRQTAPAGGTGSGSGTGTGTGTGEAAERLYLSFGNDHLLISTAPSRGGAGGGASGGAGGDAGSDAGGDAAIAPALPGGDTVAATTSRAALREKLRAGPDAGRHPGTVRLEIDGYRFEDIGRRLPLGFFTGPLAIEILPETE